MLASVGTLQVKHQQPATTRTHTHTHPLFSLITLLLLFLHQDPDTAVFGRGTSSSASYFSQFARMAPMRGELVSR